MGASYKQRRGKQEKKKQKGARWARELKEAKEMVLRAGLDLRNVGVGQAPLQMSSNHHLRENTSSVASLKTHLNPSVIPKAGMFLMRTGVQILGFMFHILDCFIKANFFIIFGNWLQESNNVT